MNKIATAGVVIAVFCWPIMRDVSGQAKLVEGAAERSIMAAETARTNAKRSGNSTSLNQLLAPDFIKVNRFGRVLGKRDTIALARNPNYATEDIALRIYDDAAVVTGRESDEAERPGNVRFLRVWVRKGDQWLEFADDATTIASEPEAARLARGPGSTVDRLVAEQAGANSNHVTEAAEAPAAVARDIRTAEHAYREAERIDDFTVLKTFRVPEFRLVDQLGNVIRPDGPSHPAIKAVEDDDFGVRVCGNLALVIGGMTRTDLINGATNRLRYSAVWVRIDGRWMVVAEQRTPIV